MNSLVQIGTSTLFAVSVAIAAVKSLVHPSRWLKPFAVIVLESLPLAVVAGFAIGVVIWVHTRGVLERTGTGAAELLPTFLAAAVLLELAPLGAGLILAARTGASLGAELASMKVNEQIDALAALGVSPVARLIGPRVLATTLAGPILFTLITSIALGSGYCAEAVTASGNWLKFKTASLDGVDLHDALLSAFKTFVFGVLVGLIACRSGVEAGPGSEGVGAATTRAVVRSVLAVMLADVILVTAFKVSGVA